jgi:hypothetical protein
MTGRRRGRGERGNGKGGRAEAVADDHVVVADRGDEALARREVAEVGPIERWEERKQRRRIGRIADEIIRALGETERTRCCVIVSSDSRRERMEEGRAAGMENAGGRRWGTIPAMSATTPRPDLKWAVPRLDETWRQKRGASPEITERAAVK